MSKSELPKRSLFRPAVNTVNTAQIHQLTPSPAQHIAPDVRADLRTQDRHKPGYMAEYMRKRRARP